MKKTVLSDIAKSLGVSVSLVSLVLNGKGNQNGISKETQQKVEDKAKELKYKPNQMARSLRLGKSNTIGLIVADISNAFYARIARGIEQKANEKGYNLIFCSTEENPEKEIALIRMLKERQVDGLIISTTLKDTTEILQLKKENFPFVLVDRYIKRLETNYVVTNNYEGAVAAMQHLIDLGHERIAILTVTPAHLSSVNDRYTAYKDILKKNDIRFNKNFVKQISFNDVENETEQAVKELLQMPNYVTAIFTVNNNLAVAVLETLHKIGKKIPEDISLVSYDDIRLFRFCVPTITAVAQPVEQIGERAVELLLSEIEKDGKKDNNNKIVLPPSFVIRNSSSKI